MGAPATALRAEFGRRPPREVLVVKPSSFGDVLHTLAPVAALRRVWPESRLTWVVNEEWAPLLEGGGLVDRIVRFPRGRFRGAIGLPRFLSWCRATLRGLRPDLALDFQGLLRSAWMSRAACPVRFAGLSDAREGAAWLTPYRAEVAGREHAVDRYFALVEALGVPRPAEPEFPLPPGEPAPLPSGPYLVLHPFARGAGKSLGGEAILQLADALGPAPVVLVGRGEVPKGLPSHVTDLVGRTSLPQLIGVLRGAAFSVSVDSGPMHLAAALSSRVLAIHTWSDPRKVGPYRPEALVWKGGKLGEARDSFPLSDLPPGREELVRIARAVRERAGAP